MCHLFFAIDAAAPSGQAAVVRVSGTLQASNSTHEIDRITGVSTVSTAAARPGPMDTTLA